MNFNFKDFGGTSESKIKPEWLSESEAELEAIFRCVIKWAMTNYKKKISKAAKKRLQVLLDDISGFYSLCLFAPSLLTMHALELAFHALTAKSDAEFLEKIGDFTTVEECGMLMTFFFDNENIIQSGPKVMSNCQDLTSFLSSVTGEDLGGDDIASGMSEMLKRLTGPMETLNDIALTESYEEMMTSVVSVMRDSLDAEMAFSQEARGATMEDITFTMLVAIVNILSSKLASFPVLKDVCTIGRAMNEVFKCPATVTSVEEAEKHTKMMRNSKTPVNKKVNDLIGRLAAGFTDNATVSMLPVKMQNKPEFDMLSKIYNESGLIIEEHDKEPRQADWSVMCVGFYNALANHYAEREWVHDDNAEALASALSGKVDVSDIDNIEKGFGMSVYEDIVVKLGYSIVAGIDDGDSDDKKEKVVKKKRVPKKKL